jgi:MFS family permease
MPDQIPSKTEIGLPILTHFKIGETPAIYLTHTIRHFGLAMIGLFIPLYILNLSNIPIFLDNKITNGLLFILIFYLCFSLVIFFSVSFVTNTIFGLLNFKGSIFTSSLLLILFLIFLSLSKYYFPFLFVAAFFYGMQTTLYWIPYHILFIRKISDAQGHYGKSFSLRVIFVKLADSLAPFIGGLAITLYSYDALFLTTIIILIISSFPVLISIHETNHGKHNAKEILVKYIKKKELRSDSISMVVENIEATFYATFWTVLLFISLNSYIKLGFIKSFSLIPIIILTAYIGKIIDKHGQKTVHKVGTIVNSLLYIPRVFIKSPILLILTDVIDTFNSTLYGIPLNTKIYENASKTENVSDYIIYRELIRYGFGSIGIFLCILLLLVVPKWQYIFLLLAIISPLTYLISKGKDDKRIKNKKD